MATPARWASWPMLMADMGGLRRGASSLRPGPVSRVEGGTGGVGRRGAGGQQAGAFGVGHRVDGDGGAVGELADAPGGHGRSPEGGVQSAVWTWVQSQGWHGGCEAVVQPGAGFGRCWSGCGFGMVLP